MTFSILSPHGVTIKHLIAEPSFPCDPSLQIKHIAGISAFDIVVAIIRASIDSYSSKDMSSIGKSASSYAIV